MLTLYLITGFLLVVGLVFLFTGIRRLWRRQPVSGSLQGASGLLCLALAGLLIAVSMNLYTYQVLVQEQPVAEVRFEALGPQYFRVYLLAQDAASHVLELRGDEWQIDARVLKWHGLANLLGMKPLYRLERLSGRYRDVVQERKSVHTVHRLDDAGGLDLWALAQKNQRKLFWLDAVYGSAAYLPMADQAQFRVSMSNSGLVVRPNNVVAQKAVEAWQ